MNQRLTQEDHEDQYTLRDSSRFFVRTCTVPIALLLNNSQLMEQTFFSDLPLLSLISFQRSVPL